MTCSNLWSKKVYLFCVQQSTQKTQYFRFRVLEWPIISASNSPSVQKQWTKTNNSGCYLCMCVVIDVHIPGGRELTWNRWLGEIERRFDFMKANPSSLGCGDNWNDAVRVFKLFAEKSAKSGRPSFGPSFHSQTYFGWGPRGPLFFVENRLIIIFLFRIRGICIIVIINII